MPGRTAGHSDWGRLPLVADTSAWARASHPAVRERWNAALIERRLRLAPMARFEILRAARGGDSFDALAESLSVVLPAPQSSSVIRSAEAAMRDWRIARGVLSACPSPTT